MCTGQAQRNTPRLWDAMVQGKAVLGGLLFATKQTKEALSYVKEEHL